MVRRSRWRDSAAFVAGLGPDAPRFDGPAGVDADRAGDYVTSEPAIVYAASAVLLFAAMAG